MNTTDREPEPNSVFDAVRCIQRPGSPISWSVTEQQLWALGNADAVAIQLRSDVIAPEVALTLAHRQAFEEAVTAGLETLLVLETGCLLSRDSSRVLAGVKQDLKGQRWSLIHLGAVARGVKLAPSPGCRHLAAAESAVGLFANVYSQAMLRRLLEEIPGDPPKLADWLAEHKTLEQYLGGLPDRFVVCPMIACTPLLLPYQDPCTREEFVANLSLTWPTEGATGFDG